MRDDLIKEIKTLSPEEKLSLTELIWENLKEEGIGLSDQQSEILRDRERKYLSGETKLYSWKAILKEIKK